MLERPASDSGVRSVSPPLRNLQLGMGIRKKAIQHCKAGKDKGGKGFCTGCSLCLEYSSHHLHQSKSTPLSTPCHQSEQLLGAPLTNLGHTFALIYTEMRNNLRVTCLSPLLGCEQLSIRTGCSSAPGTVGAQ